MLSGNALARRTGAATFHWLVLLLLVDASLLLATSGFDAPPAPLQARPLPAPLIPHTYNAVH